VKRFALYQLPLVLYAGMVFAVSSLPQLPDPGLDIPYLDKLAHFGEYLIFGLLAVRATANNGGKPTGRAVYLLAALISIAYAALDEYHQSFVVGRTADWRDFAADSLGIMAGIFVYVAYSRKNRAKTI